MPRKGTQTKPNPSSNWNGHLTMGEQIKLKLAIQCLVVGKVVVVYAIKFKLGLLHFNTFNESEAIK